VQDSYQALQKLYAEKKENLSDQEQQFFLDALQKLPDFLCNHSEQKESSEHISPRSIPDIEIPQTDYIPILQKVFEIYGIETQVCIDPTSSTIQVDKTSLNIPSTYTTLSLTRILELIQHEIETHALIL